MGNFTIDHYNILLIMWYTNAKMMVDIYNIKYIHNLIQVKLCLVRNYVSTDSCHVLMLRLEENK